MNLTKSGIRKLRLINQQFCGSSFKTAKELVKWFGAVQGQEYDQTKWGLGLRLSHLLDDDIEREFNKGEILRTHLLRPTWHLVSREDIRWLLLLSAPRVNIVNNFMYRKLELDQGIFNTCNNIIIKALQGNRQITRKELNAEFKKKKIIAEGHRLSYIMMKAELDGIICSGPRRGKQFTYALIDERVPASKTKSKDEALAELTKRYFTSRGPATVNDFSTWSGLTLAQCRKGIEMINHYLVRERFDDKDFYLSSETDTFSNKKGFRNFYLLPVLDEFIIGYKDRSAILELGRNINPKPQLSFENMIICEGQIVGTWKRIIGSKYISLQYDFFSSLNKKQFDLFKKAIRRFEEFKKLKVNYDYIDTFK